MASILRSFGRQAMCVCPRTAAGAQRWHVSIAQESARVCVAKQQQQQQRWAGGKSNDRQQHNEDSFFFHELLDALTGDLLLVCANCGRVCRILRSRMDCVGFEVARHVVAEHEVSPYVSKVWNNNVDRALNQTFHNLKNEGVTKVALRKNHVKPGQV